MRRENPQPTEKQIPDIVAGLCSCLYRIAVLKRIVSYVHLFRAERQSSANFVLAADPVQRIRKRIHVGAALVRGISAITHRKILAHLERSHAATFALLRSLVQARGIAGDGIARTSQVGARDAELRRFARARSVRENVVENPVVAGGRLVDQVRRKNVGLGHDRVAPVVFNVLIAAECIRFRPGRRAAGHVVCRLVVAEAREDRILAGKIVVDANIERSFVELSRRLVGVVEPGAVYVGAGVKLNHACGDRVNQGCRDYIAGRASRLHPIHRNNCVSRTVTFERSIAIKGIRQIPKAVSIAGAIEKIWPRFS